MKFFDVLRKRALALYVKERNKNNTRNELIWVFGEWFGQRCGDNCAYLANYVASNHPEIKVYWIAENKCDISRLNMKIKRVDRNSESAKQLLKKCGVAILGQSYADLSTDECNYASGALTVLLWHGVPWKKIGHDGNGRKGLLKSIYTKYMDFVYGFEMYVSPSNKYDKIANSAFGALKKQICHAGYPRNSDFYDSIKIEAAKERIVSELKKLTNEINIDSCKIITYMPTFRNNPEKNVSLQTLQYESDFMRFLEKENIIIIQKAHFVNQVRDDCMKTVVKNRFFLLNNVNTQDLLCATDLLVTDYSGCFFDFLVLDRPIIHYIYDYEHYKYADRGLYYAKEDVMCGTEAINERELISAIMDNVNNPLLEARRRKKMKSIYMQYESDNNCQIIYDEIIRRLKEKKQ